MNSANSIPNLFFILGCQRTGTTLMRLILESHSKIACVDESRAYNILANPDLMKNELQRNTGKDWIGFKTPRIAEQMLEPFLADYGIQFRTENYYKRKPIIFMIRNVFDTIVSMKKRFENGRFWIEEWPEATIEFWTRTNPTFVKTYRHELDLLKEARNKSIVAASIYWKFKTEAYFNYKNNNLPIVKVRYEDLITNTREELIPVLQLLDLQWEDSMLTPEKMLHVETNEDGITIGGTNTKSPIHASSLMRYTQTLTDEEIRQISALTKDLMLKFGYEL